MNEREEIQGLQRERETEQEEENHVAISKFPQLNKSEQTVRRQAISNHILHTKVNPEWPTTCFLITSNESDSDIHNYI